MANRRRSILTAGARFILSYLASATSPQSYLDISAGALLSYFHTRYLVAQLIKKGLITKSFEDGKKQPVFALTQPIPAPVLLIVESVRLAAFDEVLL